MANESIWVEAKVTKKDSEGREWDVTIIGAQEATDLVTASGREYVRSKNGRLYAVEALQKSLPMWEGVKVYDNHLTQEEFEQKQGMRSVAKEWIGTIVAPYWEETTKQLRGVLKVVEAALAAKLKAAYEAGVLNTIGLSIDTFPIVGKEQILEGQAWPTIEGFNKILSVDLVAEPAAGGGFNRLIAANILQEQPTMNEEEIKALVANAVKAALAEMAPAAQPEAVATEPEAEPETEAALKDKMKGKKGKGQMMPGMEAEADEPDPAEQAAQAAAQEARLARCELALERKLNAAKLPEAFRAIVMGQFAGKVFEDAELDAAIKRVKEAQAAEDTSGRVADAGNGRQAITVGLNERDKFELAFLRMAMGNSEFKALEANTKDYVQERVPEAYRDWVKAGRQYDGYRRLSEWAYDILGGDYFSDPRAAEAVSTSGMTSIVKNTVNIILANDYSKRNEWWAPICRQEQADTIDDFTLVRTYGFTTLSTVNEGAAYTELNWVDEEETANFIKNGNYVGVTMETLLRDKVNVIRTIPNRLANSWFNTKSARAAAVFTTNTAAGPVLADTGALFNATAATGAGGHANLLTAALSYAAYGAAREAMRKQTDQYLGAGTRLMLRPKYMLVPVDLENTAVALRNSEKLPGSANNDINPYQNEFDVIAVPEWTDTNNWALAADPQVAPAIWDISLRGQQVPQLFTSDQETAGAMFTNDTLRYKVRLMSFRFSATYDCLPVSDFRPLHKSNCA